MATNPRPLDLGPHTLAADEVISFVLEGGVLATEFHPEDDETNVIIKTFDAIDRFRDPWVDDAEISGASWFDEIRLTDEGTYMFGGYLGDHVDRGNYRRLESSFEEVEEWFASQLEKQLHGLIPSEEIDLVIDDLSTIVCARASLGRSEIFHERLYRAYRAGGYPCGWSGAFPAGNIVVFSR